VLTVKITLQKEQTSKDLAIGFSWTLFFFSFVRQFWVGSYKSGFLLLALFVGLPGFLGHGLGYALYFLLNLTYCYFCNRGALIRHLQQGYLPLGPIDRQMLLNLDLAHYLKGEPEDDD